MKINNGGFHELFSLLGLPYSSLHNNILAVFLELLYLKLAIECVSSRRFQQHKWMATVIGGRPILHLVWTSTLLFWPLFDNHKESINGEEGNWSWRLNIVAPAALLARLVYKGAVLKDPNDMEVGLLSRNKAPYELLLGPSQFLAILIWLGVTKSLFMSPHAAFVAAALGSDGGLAPVVGFLYGQNVFKFAWMGAKSLQGSLAIFTGTVSICYFLLYCWGLTLPLKIALIDAAFCSVVEFFSWKSMDNIIMTLALQLSQQRIEDWLWLSAALTTFLSTGSASGTGAS